MRLCSVCLGILLIFRINNAFAQDHLNSIALSGSFTTSSKLFLHPNDPDETVRGQFLSLANIFSIGIDVRRELKTLGAQFGLSVEYISKSDQFSYPVTSTTLIPVKDGFTVVPIELSGYFMLPIGNEHLHVSMGGGVGLYIGNRVHEFPDASAQTIERNTGYGIHVLTETEYAFSNILSLRGQLKFRDVQFTAVNQFSQPSVNYNGTYYPLDQNRLPSRLNMDGMTGTLSFAFHF